MATVFLGMGSNLGDRQKHLEAAIQKLSLLPGNQFIKVSSILENPPLIGGPVQGPFLNIVAKFETFLKPLELLTQIQQIEKDGGRQRTVFWGPRTIDIDIILYGKEVMNTPELKIPHPEMYKREFVILPLLELSPLEIDPVNGNLVRENWENKKLAELSIASVK